MPDTLLEQLELLAFIWTKSSLPDVDPGIRCEIYKNSKTNNREIRAMLDLSPKWLIGAPPGVQPFENGDTVVKIYREKTLKLADFYAAKIANKMIACENQAHIIEKKVASILNIDKWLYSMNCDADVENWLLQNYGLNIMQALIFDKEVRRIRGDAVDRTARNYDERDIEDSMPHFAHEEVREKISNQEEKYEQAKIDTTADEYGDVKAAYRKLPPDRVIGSMFGISRQAAKKWINEGRALGKKLLSRVIVNEETGEEINTN